MLGVTGRMEGHNVSTQYDVDASFLSRRLVIAMATSQEPVSHSFDCCLADGAIVKRPQRAICQGLGASIECAMCEELGYVFTERQSKRYGQSYVGRATSTSYDSGLLARRPKRLATYLPRTATSAASNVIYYSVVCSCYVMVVAILCPGPGAVHSDWPQLPCRPDDP
jgi:hypothetical protein